MAELDIFPSNTSGQAYVLPYYNSKRGLYEAQFQLWYQGLVTLFYRSGVKAIRSEIVREGDDFGFINGVIRHTYNVFDSKRHTRDAIGAYVIVELPTGGEVHKAMGKEEILNIGKKFSKSYDTGAWNVEKDPELWMWKKTVLKQCAKLVPKNERITLATQYDNEGDTDLDEVDKKIMLEKATRWSEGNIEDLLPPAIDPAPPEGGDPAPPEGGETPDTPPANVSEVWK